MTKQKTEWGNDTSLKYKYENVNGESEVKSYKLTKEELEEYLKKYKRK
jgi:hypothetical protein